MQKLRPCTSIDLFRNLVALCVLLALCQPCRAEERYTEFLEGLRQRRYYDSALDYIRQLESRTNLPTDIAESLELERGITYRALGAASRVPEDREQALAQAEQALKKFVAAKTDHPRSAYANAELGQLLFDRARSLLWDADSPSNLDRKSELQDAARKLIAEARGIYQSAHDLYKQQYSTFERFIDKAKDPTAYRARQEAQVNYLRAWFNLARCTYERGQTYDRGSKLRRDTLIKASGEFEAIHSEYRKSPIGLQSRLMMGKCFQEQDDINRALGIYNEMLSHGSTNATVMVLKSLALQYRLICLNDESRSDFQLVIQEADRWLKDKANRSNLYTESGLGILWEKAVAEEKLAQDRTLKPEQKQAVFRQALSDSRKVSKWPSPYREPSLAMGRRINAELGEQDAEPKDFDTAFERARGMVGQLKNLGADLSEAKTEAEKDTAERAIESHLLEISRLFKLALDLREEDTDKKAVAQARYLLSFVYMRQRKSLDAFILARHCMTRDKLNDPATALSATEIAIESAIQALNDADGEDQSFELALLKETCELIISDYPSSAKGNEARMRLGQVYRDLNEPALAAQTYMTVPKEFSQYASSRIQAGQSFWLSWLSTMTAIEKGEEAELDSTKIEDWKNQAEAQLIEGIAAARNTIGKTAKPTPEMTAAEVTLASILNINGRFPETIRRLTSGGPNAVAKAVELKSGEQRPDTGIKSSAFAGQLYRLLLSAYVGTQQIEPALATMDKLKSTGGQDTAEIYTQLGRELQEELERLKASGDTEGLQKTQASFEKFLEQVNAQRDPTDYNSLLWIGETYLGLGQGVSEDRLLAMSYFEKASAAYSGILNNSLAEEASVPAIKLRQVRCLRAMGRYSEGVGLAEEILAQNPTSLDVQFEAAHCLADWGDGTNGEPKKLLVSIEGMDSGDTKLIWGWSGITNRLSRRQGKPEWATLEEQFLEARYQLTNSRFRYAKTSPPDATEQLQSAQGELTSFAMVYSGINDAWYDRFNRLYQDIRGEMGEDPGELPKPEPVFYPTDEADEAVADAADPPIQTQADNGESAQAPPPEGANPILVVIALALAAGGGFAAYKLLGKPERRKRTYSPPSETFPRPSEDDAAAPLISGSGDVPDFSGLDVSAPTTAIAPPPRKKKRAAPVERSPDGTRSTDDQKRPARKKRVVTAEEAAKIKAARAAKLKAKQEAGENASSEPGGAVRRKARKTEGGSTPRKKVRKRPPQPPTE